LIRLADSNPDIVLGFEDEAWWSRERQPALHAWSDQAPLQQVEQHVPKDDPDGKAIAGYGLYVPALNQMQVRFVQGRPLSGSTCAFLAWLLSTFTAQGKRALFLIWDNASWHLSHQVQDWITAHNRQAKGAGGCRLIICALPSKSPWLNAIEPKWVHGKRAASEPARLLPMSELMQRVCDYYQCELTDPLAQPDG
jgi:hypothetical protein